jgi:hypothetical protein
MKSGDRSENPVVVALALATVAAVLVGAAAHAASRALANLAYPEVPLTLVAALVIFALPLLIARVLVVRRALRERVRFLLIPTDTFDPPDEAVLRFASALGRVRRPVWGKLDGPASAIRVELDQDTEGQLRYSIELPARARAVLRTAVAPYGEVELREMAPDEERRSAGEARSQTARLELSLAHASPEPLRDAGLDPDPLAGFARALSRARPEDGDDARVCIDLLPVTSARRRRRLLRQARRRDHRLGGLGRSNGSPADLLGLARSDRSGPAPPSELVSRRADQHALMDKLGSPESLFSIQVLVRASSSAPGIAKAQAQAILASFDTFAGDNHFRACGLRIPAVAFLGSDLPGRRQDFDRRVACGLFRPRRRRVVTASEIAGLLKPPSVKCAAPNVLRSGGAVPPAPARLPTFAGQPSLLPLGLVGSESGERMVGVPLADTFFFYCAGRSRFGKTELAMAQLIHLARAGHGCFFLDPHVDAIRKIKGYLTAEGLRDRVVEINLAGGDRQPGWNLFAVAGRPPERVREQVDAVVAAFASALGWTETNTRALNLTTQAAQALTDVARQLPPDLAPTIFQIPTLLGNDDWRAAVLPHVAPSTRQFFTDRFPRLPPEAITPVTNLIDRLRVAPALAALLGNPISTYDVRAAMDSGQIVLVSPGSGGARDRLAANLFVFDLFHAAKTRADLPPDERRVFYGWFDEVQTYDGPSGDLAALSEQTAKFGLRGLYFNQNPERLTAATLNAITTNRSHVLTTAVNAKAASLLGRELGGTLEPRLLTGLRRFEFVASVTLAGEVSTPFRVRTAPVEALFPEGPDEDGLPALDAAIDSTASRVPVAETLAALDDHDLRILDALAGSADDASPPPPDARQGEWAIDDEDEA